jgi:hypothetical protein
MFNCLFGGYSLSELNRFLKSYYSNGSMYDAGRFFLSHKAMVKRLKKKRYRK